MITELELELRSVEVSPEKLNRTLNTWESGRPYIMPFLQSKQKYYSIPSGIGSWSQDNLYTGLLPKQVLICFVPHDAFNNDLTKNGFNTVNMNICQFKFNVNGNHIIFILYELSLF